MKASESGCEFDEGKYITADLDLLKVRRSAQEQWLVNSQARIGREDRSLNDRAINVWR